MNPFPQWWGVRPLTRHSLVLAVAGTVYFLIGLSYVTTEPTSARVAALVVATNILSIKGWGVLFMLTGILSIISSRWPPASETWGYTTMTGLSAAWAGFYLMGILLGLAPAQNLSGFLVWALMAFLWWAVSGLINPSATSVAVKR